MTGSKKLRTAGLVTGWLMMGAWWSSAIADDFPPCAPPAANEYLLLIKGQTVAARDRIQNLLPTTTSVNICRYLDDIVVRAGGFSSLENANAWAQYLNEVEGAQAFVARPAAPGETSSNAPITAEPATPLPVVPPASPTHTPSPSAQPNPSNQPGSPPPLTTPSPGTAPNPSVPDSTGTPAMPSSGTGSATIPQPTTQNPTPEAAIAYSPQLLGEGYAVLVDYTNNPEVAKRIQQTLNQPVGLAVYEQRPYLLVTQNGDASAVAQVLQTLSNNRFTAFIVDSSDVVVLSAGVATP